MEGARAFAVSMKSRRNLSDSRRRFRGILTQAGYEMAPPKNGKFLANPVFTQFLSDFGFEHTIVKRWPNLLWRSSVLVFGLGLLFRAWFSGFFFGLGFRAWFSGFFFGLGFRASFSGFFFGLGLRVSVFFFGLRS